MEMCLIPRGFQDGFRRHILAFLSAATLFLFVGFLIVEEVDAQRRGFGGGGFRGGFGRGSGGGYGGFKQTPRFTPPRSMPRPSAPPRTIPQQGIPGGGGGMRSLPKSIRPNSPITSMQRFTGQATKSGSPIVHTNQGKRYAVPQKGISTSLRGNLLGSTSSHGFVSGNVSKKITALSIRGAFNKTASVTVASKPQNIGKGLGGGARNTPVGQKILRELKNNSGLSRQKAREEWRKIMDSGRALPEERVALAGSPYEKLYKIVPHNPADPKGPYPTTPYWVTEGQLKYLRQNPNQLHDMMGLPKSSTSQSYKVYEIRPQAGKLPSVFVNKVGVTYEQGKRTEGGGDQVIVPNRKHWTDPIDIGGFP